MTTEGGFIHADAATALVMRHLLRDRMTVEHAVVSAIGSRSLRRRLTDSHGGCRRLIYNMMGDSRVVLHVAGTSLQKLVDSTAQPGDVVTRVPVSTWCR